MQQCWWILVILFLVCFCFVCETPDYIYIFFFKKVNMNIWSSGCVPLLSKGWMFLSELKLSALLLFLSPVLFTLIYLSNFWLAKPCSFLYDLV